MADDSFRTLHYITHTPITAEGMGESVVTYWPPSEARRRYRKAISKMIKDGESALLTLRDENHKLIHSEFVKASGNVNEPHRIKSPLKSMPGWKTKSSR